MNWNTLQRRDRLQVAIVINQLATPGLGSWMAGHRWAGAAQLALALAGFFPVAGFFAVYIVRMIRAVFTEVMPVVPPQEWWRAGLVLFAVAWTWAGLTSLQLWKEIQAIRRQPTGTTDPPRLDP